jgi:hypothetical protein
MNFFDLNVNYTAVVIAAIAAFVIGFLWHGPLFGKQWIAMMGISQKDIAAAKAKGGMWKPMLGAFIAQLVLACTMAHFAVLLGVTDATGALSLAFWIWLGFVATIMLNSVLWESRTVKLYLFNIAYHLVSLAAVSLIVVLL